MNKQRIIRDPEQSREKIVKLPRVLPQRFVDRVKMLAMQVVSRKRRRGTLLPDAPHSTAPVDEEQLKHLVGVTLRFTEVGWEQIFSEFSQLFPEKSELLSTYVQPKLILYSGFIMTPCGPAHSKMGPFYCPVDNSIYLDLKFFSDYQRDFDENAEDVIVAVVIAHEVAHSIQKFFGILPELQQIRDRAPDLESANRVMQIIELHADYLTGVCLHHANKALRFLHENDIEESLRAALFIGDDIIQYRTTGYVTPHSFTHGSGEQRMYALKAGLESGDWETGFSMLNQYLILEQLLMRTHGNFVVMFDEKGPIY